MMETLTYIIGYTAAVAGTFLMLPQVIKSYQTKRVADLSWGMVILYVLNCILWLAYGMLLQASPMILANTVGLFISIFQVLLKLRYAQ